MTNGRARKQRALHGNGLEGGTWLFPGLLAFSNQGRALPGEQEVGSESTLPPALFPSLIPPFLALLSLTVVFFATNQLHSGNKTFPR